MPKIWWHLLHGKFTLKVKKLQTAEDQESEMNVNSHIRVTFISDRSLGHHKSNEVVVDWRARKADLR